MRRALYIPVYADGTQHAVRNSVGLWSTKALDCGENESFHASIAGSCCCCCCFLSSPLSLLAHLSIDAREKRIDNLGYKMIIIRGHSTAVSHDPRLFTIQLEQKRPFTVSMSLGSGISRSVPFFSLYFSFFF